MTKLILNIVFLISLGILLVPPAFSQPQTPMAIVAEDSIVHTWLNKPVLETKMLDGMESLAAWRHEGAGAIEISQEQAYQGPASLKMTSKTFTDTPSPSGRPPASCIARYGVRDEDWEGSNRLSFWVYPDLPGFHAISMSVVLHNAGTLPVPDSYNRLGLNFFLLKNRQWNHIVWEIAHLSRDKVTGVDFVYRMQGNEPGATDTVTFYLDQLELQHVEADHFEGWAVAPGRIAYSHTGYAPNTIKQAFASSLEAQRFSLIEAETGKEVFSAAIEAMTTDTGQFQVMDFSSVQEPGTYCIKAGPVQTRPFRIDPDVWKGTMWKTINLFYALRCGFPVPGIHSICHADWLAEHEGQRIAFNGGWHDAGDLSQGLRNTCEAAYAMFLLAEPLQDSDPHLAQRVLEEARWGLDWVMRNRFGNGYRCRWGTMDFWTDNRIGTVDDMITTEVNRDAYHNFHAVTVEAAATRLLKDSDPALAEQALRFAKEDWAWAKEELKQPRLEALSVGILASMELYKTTREAPYAEAAVAWADLVMACQQVEPTNWDIPLAGFFYESPRKERIRHYNHIGEIQLPITALVELCEQMPSHPNRAVWLACLQRFADYSKKTAEYTQPYAMLPAGIYSVNESKDAAYVEQVKTGVRLSDEYYLRRFPVWFDFRGNLGVTLSHARALSATARVIQDATLRDLVQKQLQWVMGLNPFCQSTMTGEGYDFAPQYTATSGDIVGGLPVGIQTNRHFDTPFWPADNCYNFKEIWVHPSSRWLAILADLEQIKEAKP